MDTSEHFSTTTTIHPAPLCWLVTNEQGYLTGVLCWGGGGLPMGKGV